MKLTNQNGEEIDLNNKMRQIFKIGLKTNYILIDSHKNLGHLLLCPAF
jgi:hypothetical protein